MNAPSGTALTYQRRLARLKHTRPSERHRAPPPETPDLHVVADAAEFGAEDDRSAVAEPCATELLTARFRSANFTFARSSTVSSWTTTIFGLSGDSATLENFIAGKSVTGAGVRSFEHKWCSLAESNRCFRRERGETWTFANLRERLQIQ